MGHVNNERPETRPTAANSCSSSSRARARTHYDNILVLCILWYYVVDTIL